MAWGVSDEGSMNMVTKLAIGLVGLLLVVFAGIVAFRLLAPAADGDPAQGNALQALVQAAQPFSLQAALAERTQDCTDGARTAFVAEATRIDDAFEDAYLLALSTSRIALSPIVADMQRREREMRSLAADRCGQIVQQQMADAYAQATAQFLAFMQQKEVGIEMLDLQFDLQKAWRYLAAYRMGLAELMFYHDERLPPADAAPADDSQYLARFATLSPRERCQQIQFFADEYVAVLLQSFDRYSLDAPSATPAPAPTPDCAGLSDVPPTPTPGTEARRATATAEAEMIATATAQARATATAAAQERATAAAQAQATSTTKVAAAVADAAERTKEEVLVPAGEFVMGCDDDATCNVAAQPAHTVSLEAFYIDKYEVTVARYSQCVDAGRCTPPYSLRSAASSGYYNDLTRLDYPVINVLWQQAQEFCTWDGKRLPTEAEWEKAAIGDDGRIYPWGSEEPSPDFGNFGELANDTVRVGSLASGASPFGVMDMAGNVLEWTADWFQEDYYLISPVNDPTGPEDGVSRTVRGGSYYKAGGEIRPRSRSGIPPMSYFNYLGFRCARPAGEAAGG